MYQIHTNPTLLEPSIFKINFGWIPADPLNTDYLEYVQWLFEGNEPEEWIEEQ